MPLRVDNSFFAVSDWIGTMVTRKEMEAAVLAERESNAKIAEHVGSLDNGDDPEAFAYREACVTVAARIRGGK